MNGFILFVDNQGLLKGIADATVDESLPLRHAVVDGIAAAKRKLMQDLPLLIVSMVSFIGDDSAGFTFCDEIRQHSSFSDIPVILVADSLTDELIRRGTECGAKGVVTWPVSAEALRRRIRSLLPEALQHQSAVLPQTARPGAPRCAGVGSAGAASKAPAFQAPPSEMDEKLKSAQMLLARVLHNLKTSDLLQVVELEDVPRVVYEMCRSVCGFKDTEPSPARTSTTKGSDVEMDLDRAFGKASKR